MAQITLNNNGHAGLGVNPSNLYRLSVSCGTNCGGGTKAGTYVTVVAGSGTINNYGVYSHVTGSAAYSYGVRGYAGGSSANYGIHGSAGSSGYGGYFTQGLYVSGGITQPSDERLKTNIRELNRQSAWDGIQQLRPLRYEFLSEDELRQRGLPASHYAEGEYLGLSAQDVEAVFPELVKDVSHPPDGDKEDTSGTAVTKGINYQGLVIALIATVQELQARVEALEADLRERR